LIGQHPHAPARHTQPAVANDQLLAAGECYLVTDHSTSPTMNNLLNLLIVLLILGWLVGYFAFPDVGGLIHLLLVIALIVIVYRLLTGRKIT